MTYRLGDHTTADDARRYRDSEELDQWKLRDPITRLAEYLKKKKLWNSGKEEALLARAKQDVSAVVERAETIAAPPASDIFDHTYAEPTPELRIQRETMRTSSLGQEQLQVESRQEIEQ